MGAASSSKRPNKRKSSDDDDNWAGVCAEYLTNLVRHHLWLSQFTPRQSMQSRLYHALFLILLIAALLLGHLELWLKISGHTPTVNSLVILCWAASTVVVSYLVFGLRLAVEFLKSHLKCTSVGPTNFDKKADISIHEDRDRECGAVFETQKDDKREKHRPDDLHGIDNEAFQASDETLRLVPPSPNREGSLRQMTLVEIISSMFGFRRKPRNSEFRNRNAEDIELQCMKPKQMGSVNKEPKPMELKTNNKSKKKMYQTTVYCKLGTLGKTETIGDRQTPNKCISHEDFYDLVKQLPPVVKKSSRDISQKVTSDDEVSFGVTTVDVCHTIAEYKDDDDGSVTEGTLAITADKSAAKENDMTDISSSIENNGRAPCKIKCVHCKDHGSDLKSNNNTQNNSEVDDERHDVFDSVWDKILSQLFDQTNTDPDELAETINKDLLPELQPHITTFAKTLALKFMDAACKSIADRSPEVIDNFAHADDVLQFMRQLNHNRRKEVNNKAKPGSQPKTKSDSALLGTTRVPDSLGQHIRVAVRRMTIRQAKACLQEYAKQLQPLNISHIPVERSPRPTLSHQETVSPESPEGSPDVGDRQTPNDDLNHDDISDDIPDVETTTCQSEDSQAEGVTVPVSGQSSHELLRRLSLCSLGFNTAGIDEDRLELATRASLESLEDEEVLEVIEEAADKVQERQLVTISSDIVSKVMLKAREILNNSIDVQVSSDAKSILDKLLALGEPDVTSQCLPSLVDYISSTLFSEVQHSQLLRDRLRTAVLTGQYIDTLITNAFLRAEHQLQVSRQTVVEGGQVNNSNSTANTEGGQANNSNSAPPETDKTMILGFIMETMFRKLKVLVAEEPARRDDLVYLADQEKDIMCHLPEFAASDVGTQVLWHAVQGAYEKVKVMADDMDVSQMALERGWVKQLGNHFLVGGDKLQDHLAVVEVISDVLLRESMGAACDDLAEELLYFMCAGSVDAALTTRLQGLSDVTMEQAERVAQKARKSLPDRVRPFLVAIGNFAKALKTQMQRGRATPSDRPTSEVTGSASSSATVVSLQVTDSDPWMKHVTTPECSDMEPLLEHDENNVRASPNLASSYQRSPVRRELKSRQSSAASHPGHVTLACCHLCLRSILCLILITIPTSMLIAALDAAPLSPRALSTWLLAVTCSLFAHALLLEPLALFVRTLHEWIQARRIRQGYRLIPGAAPWINPELWPGPETQVETNQLVY